MPLSIPLAGGSLPTGTGAPVPSPLGAGGFRNLSDFLNYTFQLQQQQRAGPPPASKTAIERLEEVKVSSAHMKTQALCSVCQEAFGEGDSALGLPCDHLYHPDCITPWLTEHNTCPMCRYELPTDDAEYERGRVQRMQKRDEAKRQRDRKCELGRMRNEDCVLVHTGHADVEEDGVEEVLTELECGHVFHSECLDEWSNIAGRDRCPSCRKSVTFPERLAGERQSLIPRKKRRVDETHEHPVDNTALEVKELKLQPSVLGLKDDMELSVTPSEVSILADTRPADESQPTPASQPDIKMEKDTTPVSSVTPIAEAL